MSPRIRSRNTSVGRVALLSALGASASVVAFFRLSPLNVFVPTVSFAGRSNARVSGATSRRVANSVDPAADLSPEQDMILQCLSKDSKNIVKDGLTFTPLSADLQYVDPVFKTEGRLPYQLFMLESGFQTLKNILDPDSVKFDVKSMKIVDGNFNPFGDVAHPPRSDAPEQTRPASFAAHVVWEITGEGRFSAEAPNGMKLFDQKSFYFSGQDVFRVDAAGRVFRHESSWDHDPSHLLAYLNPLGHVPMLDSVLPVFSGLIPAREADPKMLTPEATTNSGSAQAYA